MQDELTACDELNITLDNTSLDNVTVASRAQVEAIRDKVRRMLWEDLLSLIHKDKQDAATGRRS